MRKAFYPSYLAVAFLFTLTLHLTFFQRFYNNSAENVIVKITKGDNLTSVATKLESGQVIFNKILFIAVGKVLGYQNNIIPGEYKFSNGLTNLDILKLITDPGGVRRYTITIPEGLTIRQIGRLLKKNYNLDSARFVYETNNDSLLIEYGIKANNLEGFLFPDTYEVNVSSSGNPEKDLINIMFNNFKRKLSKEITDKINAKGLKLKDVITMASIIEGETKYIPEKKTVSGVYYNRIKKNMRLEADPTVQYALPEPKKRLVYSDLKFVSPYNTYLNKGLPPGPINNPGLESIIAAIDPEQNKYLYFVAKGDGSHRFAETYDEHKKNIELYKKFLEEQEKKKTQK